MADLKETAEKVDAKLDELAAKVERQKLTKWVLLALAVVLLIAIGLWASKAWAGGQPHYPNFGGGAEASARAIAGASAGAVGVGGGGSATAEGGSYRAIGLGMPSFANGALTCEAGIPVIGGTYERESCAILRDAAAVSSLTRDDAATKEVLCNAPRIREAYKVTGRPCKSPEPERRW